MKIDQRGTADFQAVKEHLHRLHAPAFGRPSALRELTVSADGDRVAVCGAVLTSLESSPRSAIFAVQNATLTELHPGEGSAVSPAFSPVGDAIAFLSDREHPGTFRAYIGDGSDDLREVDIPAGNVEYLRWSPDGGSLLIGVADPGSDKGAVQGSGTTLSSEENDAESWLPSVVSSDERAPGRSLWVYECGTESAERVSTTLNVWEADWCGPEAIVALTSEGTDEDDWYRATLTLIDLLSAEVRLLHHSDSQMASLCGSPDGRYAAVVEGISSDRGLVAGSLLAINTATETVTAMAAVPGDVTHAHWVDNGQIGWFGIDRVESIAGTFDVGQNQGHELLRVNGSLGGTAIYPAGVVRADGAVVSIHESYDVPQAIVRTRNGEDAIVYANDHAGTDYLRSVAGSAEIVRWEAADGLEIEGILCRPEGPGPFPLVTHIHGGPVWSFRPTWGMSYPWVPLLVSRGYAVLHPNPRGSTGRGPEFTELVVGDMGGGDAEDILAGIDHLIDRGLADPDRIGLMGGSYGGFMSSWLVTRDSRFAAAVPFSPVTDWFSQSLTSNIGVLRDLFLLADLDDPGSLAHQRSPALNAANVRTPCLSVAGGLDKCTPAGQAEEFHRALKYHGVPSSLVIYPEEGHGVRQYPALIDFITRLLVWFERYMPPTDPLMSSGGLSTAQYPSDTR